MKSMQDFIYPAHWWASFPEEQRYWWEILPQAARQQDNEVIVSKRNELGLLSNFAHSPFVFKNKKYASLEGFWQSMKYPEIETSVQEQWPFDRQAVEQMWGLEAQRAGVAAEEMRSKLGITWVTFDGQKIDYKGLHQDQHYDLIEAATIAKVEQNPEVQRILLSTGNLILKPDHEQDPQSPRAWRYFEIMMKIRNDFQKNRHHF